MRNNNQEIPPLLAQALDATEDLIYVMRVEPGRFVYHFLNEAASKFSGVTSRDLGKSFLEVYAQQPEMAQYLHNKYNRVLAHGESMRFEDGYLLPNGLLSGESIISPVRNKDKVITHLICITRDYTERNQYQEKLRYYAYHDELTQLFNRRFLSEYVLEEGILYLLDIDNFKNINDMLGHDNGDTLLIEVTDRIKKIFSTEEIICRMGGDEFLIISGNPSDKPERIAERVLRIMDKVFLLKGREVKITASLGVSRVSTEIELSNALRHAAIALHHAKSLGRSRYHIFDTSLQYEQIIRFNLELELNNCVEKQELQLLYQPIYSVKQQQVITVEALLRWNKNHTQMVSPAEFIPVAEETRLIIPIGEWVIRQACRDLPQLQQKYGQSIRVAINISRVQLDEPDFIERLNQIAREEGIPAHYIDLEITESVATSNTVEEQSSLVKLREQGYTISLDDFGTGYSSLSMLTRLPIDTIKIDRSFVTQMNPPVLKALIMMAEALSLNVVAEGIEDQEQCQHLLELGYTEFQGYWFSHPVAAAQLPELSSFPYAPRGPGQ
ncbi:putative bifunctional diguanylate cyclase/phosphodiesterase [Paenibacillus sp. Z6-24]